MNQKTREEFEKLSKADQEWVLEVLRLLRMMNKEQQQAAIGLAEKMAAYNTLSQVPVGEKGVAV